MKEELQDIELAKLDGREILEWRGCIAICGYAGGDKIVPLPDYHTSYDAIIPLIIKLLKTTHEQIDFQDLLYDVLDKSRREPLNRAFGYVLITATPAELAETLLRMFGKWKDE
jgi:hypothetical protein